MFVFLFAYEKMFNIVLTGQTKITSYMSTGKRPVYDVHVFALMLILFRIHRIFVESNINLRGGVQDDSRFLVF